MYTGTHRDSKTQGDIIGISQNYKTVEKWTITAYLEAAVHATFKEVCVVQGQQQEKELSNIQKWRVSIESNKSYSRIWKAFCI